MFLKGLEDTLFKTLNSFPQWTCSVFSNSNSVFFFILKIYFSPVEPKGMPFKPINGPNGNDSRIGIVGKDFCTTLVFVYHSFVLLALSLYL